MSQHHFNTTHQGRPVSVMMGWDRPLQGFFMLITDQDGAGDEFIYSNLDDPELEAVGGMAQTIEPFSKKLQELAIAVPAQFLKYVEMDGIFNTGNKQVHYTADGHPKTMQINGGKTTA